MDKNTYKVLEYIRSKDTSKSYCEVIKKFKKHKNPSAENSIFMLDTDKMVTVDYSYDENHNATNPLIVTTIAKGKDYLETSSSQKFADHFARVMSIIAIIISLMSLALFYFKSK